MLSSTQLVELFIVLSTLHTFRYTVSRVRSAFAHAQAKGGPVRPDTVPTGLRGTLFTALQLIVCFLIPMGYMLAVVVYGLQQPPWMSAFALPDVVFGVNLEGGFWKHLLRVLACATGLLGNRISESAFEHLGDQYHPIGRRERPRVVQTGPYAWVRHPLYSLALLQGVSQSLVFWSYVPLFALVAVAGVFAIKINIEEEVIQRDDAIREEYRAYMRKVPARLVPYVW
ncbi:hypothetical protein EV363DRAFT_701465 [Boletus edulis]|nr:hypothetical protein EV363DRAFT_701465 [Boletus edulis]